MILACAAALLLAGGAADSLITQTGNDGAITPVVDLPEVRVEAPRWVDHALPLPFAGTVLDRARIEASGAHHLGEILEPLAGVRITTTGGAGSFTPISIRGSSNDQVLILRDGRRLNAAQGGGSDLSQIPLDNVERIEVMRGSASSLYGADAIGGVVNLVSRDAPESFEMSGRSEVGSFGTGLLSGHVAAGWPSSGFTLDGRLVTSDGPPPFTSDVPGYEDAYGRGDLHSGWIAGKGTFHSRAVSSIDLSLNHDESRQGIPGSIEFPTPSAEQDDEFSSAAIDLTGLLPGGANGIFSVLSAADRSTSLGGFAQRRFRRYSEPDNPLGSVDESHRNESFGLTLEHRRDFGAAGRFTLAADWRREDLHSTTDGDHRRATGGVSLRQAIDATSSLTLTPSLRWDEVGDFGSHVSPKLFASFQLSKTTALRASAGSAFRPPAFDDLFYPPRASAAGNPDLHPETSRDADLGVSWKRDATSFAVTGFANRITDLIQWHPGAAGIWRPSNVDGARILGLEVEAAGSVALDAAKRLELETNLTFLDPRETGSAPNTGGKVLIYRPRWKANALARLPVGRVTLETSWGWTGAVFTTRANTKELPGYLLGDFSVRWRAASWGDLEGRVLNMTDEIYEDYRGYPVPGREWRLAAVVRGKR